METCHCFAQAVHVICLLVLMSFHFSAMCQKETVYKATLQTKKKKKKERQEEWEEEIKDEMVQEIGASDKAVCERPCMRVRVK